MVIGHGGELVRRLCNETGCRINASMPEQVLEVAHQLQQQLQRQQQQRPQPQRQWTPATMSSLQKQTGPPSFHGLKIANAVAEGVSKWHQLCHPSLQGSVDVATLIPRLSGCGTTKEN